jgi:hypothetical protein
VRQCLFVGCESVDQVVEIASWEAPMAGLGDGVVADLDVGQSGADLVQVAEVVTPNDPPAGPTSDPRRINEPDN